MCGRYYIDIDEKEFKEIIHNAEKNIYKEYKTGEIFPSNIAPIYIQDEKAMRPILAKWGFPKWNEKGLIINARAETITEKQMFNKLIVSNRCAVPASAYFEWRENTQNNKIKDKYIIKKSDSILYFAGLYNIVPKHKSAQISMFDTCENEKDVDIFFTIITKEANSSVSHIHDRMPLIFGKFEIDDWFSGESINDLIKRNDNELYNSIVI